MFEDENIERDKIIPLNKSNPFMPYGAMTVDELREFIDNAVRLIRLRNRYYDRIDAMVKGMDEYSERLKTDPAFREEHYRSLRLRPEDTF